MFVSKIRVSSSVIGHKFNAIHSISEDVSDIKPASGSIGHVVWDEWHHRKMLVYGGFSDVGTKLKTVSSLFSCSHPLTYRRRLAQTKGGIVSIVPRDAQEGDVICKFLGSPVPYVEHYTFTGECYVDSLMQRELRPRGPETGKQKIAFALH